MKYGIHYFSGTGNTARAIGIISDALCSNGNETEIQSIEESPGTGICSDLDGLIIAFPVYSLVPPAIVLRYIKKITPKKRIPAYVLSCDGGGSLSAPKIAAHALKRRGFDVHLAGSVTYTENWVQFVPVPDEAEQTRITTRGDEMARSFARRILDGDRGIQSGGFIGWLLSIVGRLYLLLGRRFLGKVYIADSDCNSCGRCVKTCPVNCISMRKLGKTRRPSWGFNCEGCNRCINICPKAAINVSLARMVVSLVGVIAASWLCISLWTKIFTYLGLSGVGGEVVNVLGIIVALGLGHLIALGPLEVLLSAVQRIPGLSGFFERSHTKKYKRYLAPGFKLK